MEPTVYLVIAGNAITRDEKGEILEADARLEDGSWDWANAGVCDHRGGGGAEGYRLLSEALDAAEENARMLGFAEPARVP